MNAYKIGIIGLGNIAKEYKNALNSSVNFKLVAVCDINPKSISRHLYDGYPFYLNFRDMLKQENLDLVIISTAPETHFLIAKECMNFGVGVLLEKPATLHIEDIEELVSLSEKKNLIFDCIFHWQHANEVMYLLKNYPNSVNFTTLEILIEDPYTLEDGKTIKIEKVPLNGVWNDSGINALSFVSMLVDMNTFTLFSKVFFIDKASGLPYYSKHIFMKNDRKIIINVNWRKNIFYKRTYLSFEDKKLKIIHHREQIYENKKLIFQGVIENRLSSHYENYFKSFNAHDINHSKMISIHKILFKSGSENHEKN